MNFIHKFKEWLSEDTNWEEVQKYELVRPEFEIPSDREQLKARNLLKAIKSHNYDVAVYDMLEPETQKFFRYLLMLEIKSVKYAVDQFSRLPIDHSAFERLTRERKIEAINCWKFLEMIQEKRNETL